ncbi:MAG: hypothetical protein HRT89_09040, partial [Lentisphaeria bacterium]|nr:hypothetical protein [Lentisphaeria bacterium]
VFGHVWTNEDMREKGAASHLNEVVINAFKSRGRALLLGTTYDTVPYKIYQKYGFNGIEKESGYMDYYSDSKAEFEDYFFATDNLQMRPVGWLDWPTAPCLYLNSFPGVVRSMQMGIIGRSSTEGGMLGLIKHNESNDDKLAWSLYNPQTGAVLATAGYRWHPLWPETLILDFYSHPDCWERCHDLIEKLKLPETTRLVAYSDFENPRKNRVLADLGFSEVAEFQNRVYKDTAKTVLVDVFEYEKRK